MGWIESLHEWRGWRTCVGGMLGWEGWKRGWLGLSGWCAKVDGMFFLLLLLLLKYSPKKQNVECLPLKQK